ncbi:MAG: malonyl-ACP O-methyltransferase BioC [Mariprofundales bacterium]
MNSVQQAFSKSAINYDKHAVLQREIAERLLAHLEYTKTNPKRILDIGCGTGYFTRLLHKKYPKAEIIALDMAAPMLQQCRMQQGLQLPWQGRVRVLQADGQALPISSGVFDLVCSNLAMQWMPQPMMAMVEMQRVLADEGLMLFSTFGQRTLNELRQTLISMPSANQRHILPFPDVTDVGDMLMQLDVSVPVSDCDVINVDYPDCMALVRELKGLGASAAAISGRPRGLYGRALLRQLQESYPKQDSGRICATFEAIYAQAWKHSPNKSGFHIPIKSI